MNINTAISQVCNEVISGSKKATKYLSDNYVIKATRQGKLDKRSHQQTIIVTYGKPNYAERKFIKNCKSAGETFPIRNIQVI